MNYHMLEFKDFFFSTVTCRLYRNQNRYACYYYDPKMSLNKMYEVLYLWCDKGMWPQALRRFNIFNRGVLAHLFGVMRPHEMKQLILYFVSHSNMGKTSMLSFLHELVPPSLIKPISKDLGQQDLAEKTDAVILIFEEAADFLNKGIKTHSSVVYPLLDGTAISVNKKFGQRGDHYFRSGMVMNGNPKPNDVFYESRSEPMRNRVCPVVLEGKPYSYHEQGKKVTLRQMRSESSLIILWLGLSYLAEQENYSSMPQYDVFDIISDEDTKRIDKAIAYVNGETHDLYDEPEIEYEDAEAMLLGHERERNEFAKAMLDKFKEPQIPVKHAFPTDKLIDMDMSYHDIEKHHAKFKLLIENEREDYDYHHGIAAKEDVPSGVVYESKVHLAR
jgi:hypothetical protein